MIPAFTRNLPLGRLKSDKVDYLFDYRTTPAVTGLISEVFRNQKDAIRSRHPTNSVVALGQLAEFVTEVMMHRPARIHRIPNWRPQTARSYA